MATNYLLLVHGMGTHPKGEISGVFKTALTDAATQGFQLDNFVLDGSNNNYEEVVIEEFNYSDTFNTIRNKWAQNADSIKVPNASSKTMVSKILNKIADLDDDDNVFNTHWLDVLIYALSDYHAELERIKLSEQIGKLIEKSYAQNGPTGFKNVHVLGHSLGTAMVHDTLHKMYSTSAFNDYHQLPSTQPLGSVWMMSNVSKLVNTISKQAPPHSSIVHNNPAGVTDNFITARNVFDPFTWIKQFNSSLPQGSLYETDTVHYWNTHDLSWYIKIPDIAERLLRIVCEYYGPLNMDMYNNFYKQNLANTPNLSWSDIKQIRIDLINSTESLDSLQALYTHLAKAFNAIKEFSNQCQSDNA